jgi:recombination protein RecT
MNEHTLQKTNASNGKIADLIKSARFKSAVAAALPAHLRPDRFVRIALTALTRTPKLSECDQTSFFQCLLTLSQLGLEPDGRLAHLIPFRNSKRNVTECTLIVDYKGLVDLAMRSGKLSYVHADKICENDLFEYDKGAITMHKVNFKLPRGTPFAYYALVRNKDGTEKCDVMTKSEIDAIRARSRAKDEGPWKTDYDEMAKKTVFRRLSKWLQLSPEYRDALEHDADRAEDIRFAAAVPIERAVIEKPAKPAKRKQVKDGSKTIETPNADEVTKRLGWGNYTWTDLRELALAEGWVDSKEEHLDEDQLAALLDMWPRVADKLDERKSPKTVSQEPEDALFR